MIIVGLTGSIAMGKSETARMFRAAGVPVFDADAEVHRMYEPGGEAVAPVLARFPGCASEAGGIDRVKLSQRVLNDTVALRSLESIVHPLVSKRLQDFLAEGRAMGWKLAVIDNPLLFEMGRADEVDKIVVVSAPEAVQRQRAMLRPGMTEEKLAAILARQMPDEEKRRRADYVVDTAVSLEDARRQVVHIIAELLKREGQTDDA